jgi:hypothetical protein
MQATKFLEELHDGAPLRLDVDPREFYAPSARKAEVVPA